MVEKAGIDVVPAAGLRADVGVEACISADLRSLYIDLDLLNNPRMAFRVHFSVAHELGHAVLHGHVFDVHAEENPRTVSEWARHVQERVETPMLEAEAHEFAGCLLVPESALRDLYEECHPVMLEAFQKEGWSLDAMDFDRIRAYLASHIHRKFEVSATVIEIRLRKLGIIANH